MTESNSSRFRMDLHPGDDDRASFRLVAEIGDAMGMPIVILTYPDLRFAMSNGVNCRLLGQVLGRDVSERDLIGRTVREAAPPLLPLADIACQVGRTRQTAALEPICFPAGGGENHYLKVHCCPIMRYGRVVHIVGIGVDITREVAASRAIKESEERFRLSLSSSPVMAYATDRNLRYTWAYVPFLEKSGAILIGKRADELMDPEGAREVLEFKQAVLDSGQGARREIAFRIGGVFHVFDLQVDPSRDESGNIIGLNGVGLDITERTRSEEERVELLVRERTARVEAERQTAQLRALLSNLAEGVTIRDATGRLILRNRKAAEITGVSDEQAATVDRYPHVRQFDSEGNPVPPGRELMNRIARGEAIDNEEYVLLRPDGRKSRVAYTSGAIKDADGKVVMTVSSFHDVTELRRLERAKDEFLSVMAHELRNPLTAASGLLQLSIRRLGTDTGGQVGGYLRLALSELNRLGRLISDIITGYRVSSGRLPLRSERLDLAEVIAESIAPYRDTTDHHWLVALPAEAEVKVSGDRQRLTEVLANLFSNATKYSPAGSRIWASVDRGPDSATVRVEDEGIGIPTDQLERVFDGFHRATNLNNRQPGGIGLGLYISRDVARRHGGDLWAENRPGGGTVMKLRLPLAVQSTTPPRP